MSTFVQVPDWFSWENQGTGLAVADLSGTGRQDLVVLAVDSPPGQNRGVYRIGRGLDANGNVTGGWTPWLDVPDWFSWENQGTGLAVADLSRTGRLDVVVLAVDSPPGPNRGLYRVGRGLDADGNVAGGWTPWLDVPDWFAWENQGAGLAVADLSGTGRLDLVVLAVDDPPGPNRGVYRVGRGLDADGNVTGGWAPWLDVPDWFAWENQGAGLAVADVDGDGRDDLVVFMIDNPAGQNQALYRFGLRPDGDGGVAAGGWSTWLGVPNWGSFENQGGAIATVEGVGVEGLAVIGVDAPEGPNAGRVEVVPLRPDPARDGAWEVLPFSSQVLAVHAGLLHTGDVMFFAGSGNNPVRAGDPAFGDTDHGIWTSVVWDPRAPGAATAFSHPDTLRRPDGTPFDFFCCGHTVLADGRLLAAGGNLAYPGQGHGSLGLRETASFDPAAGQWSLRATMAHGRWYPTLVTLGDGRVLAASGLNQTTGGLNNDLEIYDPATDTWGLLPAPHGAGFLGLPLYAHLFLLADGQVFFSGGRMDDGSPQGPCLLDLAGDPVDVVAVAGLDDPAARNQSASVLLPPAQDQRVMILAGGPMDASNAIGGTAIVDLGSPTPQYAPAAPLSLPRMHLNATLLPDRTVLVTGGALKREDHLVARLQCEIYDPATDSWRAGASAGVVRLYHSVALLLPDGRVVTASGNPPPYGDQVPWEPADENEELRLEVYSPPYLFAGPRPVISDAQEQWPYGSLQTVACPQAPTIRRACLIRAGVTTHAFDSSQRLVDLPIVSRANGEVRVTLTDEPNIAPPGWYMLFLESEAGVPSVARWVQVGAG